MFEKKHIVIIFLLALIIRIVYALAVTHPPLETDSKDYDTLGVLLSQGKGYVNASGEPTAFRPPIYPVFLGTIYFIAGHDLLWVRLMQAILGTTICLFVYFIATIIFDELQFRHYRHMWRPGGGRLGLMPASGSMQAILWIKMWETIGGRSFCGFCGGRIVFRGNSSP